MGEPERSGDFLGFSQHRRNTEGVGAPNSDLLTLRASATPPLLRCPGGVFEKWPGPTKLVQKFMMSTSPKNSKISLSSNNWKNGQTELGKGLSYFKKIFIFFLSRPCGKLEQINTEWGHVGLTEPLRKTLTHIYLLYKWHIK